MIGIVVEQWRKARSIVTGLVKPLLSRPHFGHARCQTPGFRRRGAEAELGAGEALCIRDELLDHRFREGRPRNRDRRQEVLGRCPGASAGEMLPLEGTLRGLRAAHSMSAGVNNGLASTSTSTAFGG
jgi:hypothetical protein